MDMELRQTLISMSEAESTAWHELTADENRYGDVPKAFESLRSQNAEALHRVIKSDGWPGRSLVGVEGEKAAFSIARNAINKPTLMKEFLKHIKNAVLLGEANIIHEACLQDCILFYQNKPQRYGMFFDWDESGKLAVNVENIDLANKNRSTVGLETIEQAMSKHENDLRQEDGGRPKDIKEHKRRLHQWATDVGWIHDG